jgi:RND family efflux transporter MFP subunit
MRSRAHRSLVCLALVATAAGCGGESEGKAKGGGSPGGPAGGYGSGAPGIAGEEAGAVPVEVALVERRAISSFLETNGALEAENDVEIVARTAGPIVKLHAEEGMRVREGQLLLEIDEAERRAQVEIAKVALEEANRAHERAQAARESEIVSQEVYDTALARLESAQAQLSGSQILYQYTKVTAPFDGIVADRFVKLGETVQVNQRLFRLTDFDPLLCKIQVPEKELSRLSNGQKALVEVEAWPEERFDAEVLRVSPVVEAATGTIRVTLQVRTRGKLSPGMFASVFLVTDTRADAVVMPKRALSLESLTNTVFVAKDGLAERRELTLGYEETDDVEVLSGLEAGERVIVVGQDGLTDATPVQVVAGPGAPASDEAPPARQAFEGEGRAREGDIDFASLTPEQIERIKKRMRDRGLTDEQIEERLKKRQQSQR